ncbi:hypothetical protein G7B40_008655 [Aetokthonos hydrillicola Thurmond2011]|jgi:uncharacterized membrane protein YecN with MAPEG domain|uniref:Uncharacterized protein n=1 Tax=Aetokthonos hydrillicola Thurmond2011 TaxID=2712845 RepID=A0AAP5I3Z1_9CYAN|nr:hypothetical protein [Aetokthonos hydrillicola]MBO3457676.1 hypothetical protein [Aetokthonos hydrillicola CCALA 1050]MBW4587955.1 hypothetical protein [Aetokthonos hydrillicola CCALA 1050]MDR9894638.1 hypothetical protein [Aetokthonos hydrillicola Thurmond2011]
MDNVKLFLGIGLLLIGLYIGVADFSPWMIPLLGMVYTAAYIQGKWYLWAELFRRRNSKFYQSLVITYLIQTGLVFVLYWLGRGVGYLLS